MIEPKTQKPTPAQSLQGRRAQSNGDLFERFFQFGTKRRGIVTTRFPNGCKRISASRVIEVKTPFDWILSYQGKTALIDTKTCAGKSFRHSSVEQHQISTLYSHELAGTLSGYVVWLRETDVIFFLPASVLSTLQGLRGSVTEKHPKAISLGSSQHFDPLPLFTTLYKPEPSNE